MGWHDEGEPPRDLSPQHQSDRTSWYEVQIGMPIRAIDNVLLVATVTQKMLSKLEKSSVLQVIMMRARMLTLFAIKKMQVNIVSIMRKMKIAMTKIITDMMATMVVMLARTFVTTIVSISRSV